MLDDENEWNGSEADNGPGEEESLLEKYRKMVQPMQDWEESSCFSVIPGACPAAVDEELGERIRLIEGVEMKEWELQAEAAEARAVLTYQEEEYEVSFSLVSIPPEALEDMVDTLPEEDQPWCRKETQALVIIMRFGKVPQRSYHLQLKLAAVSVPDFVLLLDESAERFFSGRWVNMSAMSALVPPVSSLYAITAVADEDQSRVWLHTHGLCRCGLSELEVLDSNPDEYHNHAELVRGVAQYMIDHIEEDLYEKPLFVGTLQGGKPIVATLIPWPTALTYYEGLTIGGPESREDSHNSLSSVIFLYRNQKAEDLGKFSKVSVYDGLWGDDPIYYVSQRETSRMSAVARERFDIAVGAFQQGKKMLVKVGLLADEEHQNDDGDLREHIWFEMEELLPDGLFRARLTQAPFWVGNMKIGDTGVYGLEQVTDWLVELEDYYVSPENAYVLID